MNGLVYGLLEPCAGKLARTVLRGRGGGDAALLPDGTKGWQVRRGEKGTTIQFWKFSEEKTTTNENGEPVKVTVQLERPRVFYATVFNAEQIDGIPLLQSLGPPQWNAHERAERILQSSGAIIKYAPGSAAFYRPSTDTIHLPERSQFPAADGFYAIALHEVGHNAEAGIMPRRMLDIRE